MIDRAAGGDLTARQAPRRPGTAPAPGLRAGRGRLVLPTQTIRASNRKARRPMARRWRALSVAPVLLAGAAGLIYLGAAMVSRPEPGGQAPSPMQDPGEENAPTQEELELRRQTYLHREAVKHR